MKIEVNPEYVLGTWTATNTSYKDSTKLYTNGTGNRLKLMSYAKRTNSSAPTKALTFNSDYLTGLWYEGNSPNVSVYRGDLKTNGKRIDVKVYFTDSDLTITEARPDNR